MIVVDNFRTVLLVGLICTVWISPSFAAMCAGKADACADTDKYCFIDENAKEAGCKADGCPDGSDAAFTCKEGKCCCLATDTPCNTWATVKDEACKDATLAALDACKMGPTGGPPDPNAVTTGGPGGDTPPPPTGGNKCTIKISAENSTEPGSCPKACQTKTDGSEFKCIDMCEKDECGDTTCCCKSETEACTITLSTGNSLASLGSLQVVTLVAAALYFFPVKTSS